MELESELDFPLRAARERLAEVRREPRIVRFAPPGHALDPRLDLRLALECEQETGSFKVRGAWNQVSQLSESETSLGVVTASSGNHGKALAWAAQRRGVRAAICMPENAYPSKIDAARRFGAEVRLAPDRQAAEREAAELAEAGWAYVAPYDAQRTIEGQGTVALDAFERWPALERLIVPVGGGGLYAGCCLAAAARRHRGLGAPEVHGVEPEGADALRRSLEAGHAVALERVTSAVQGLTPPGAGKLPFEIVREHGSGVSTVTDEQVFRAQAVLVRGMDLVVEPAGAASLAFVLEGGLASQLEGRSAQDPLRVLCVVSGGNPDPAQLDSIRVKE
jgi:threonine dehydratase